MAALVCIASGAASAQVYRCETAGRILYTDAPCASGAVRSVEVDGNRIESVPVARPLGVPAPGVGNLQQVRPMPGDCPSDLDLKNIETRLSGQLLPVGNRRALHHERWKALECRAIGARYDYGAWKRLEGVLRGED
jgi:hypothetical protein